MARFTAQPRCAVTQPLDEAYRFIALTQNQVAIVDAEDFERLSQWAWHAAWRKTTKSFYAMTTIKNRRIGMHRLILGDKEADHINHNTLDYRKENLRQCTRAQNVRSQRMRCTNTSGFRGVSWAKNEKKWVAKIKQNYKQISLGYYHSVQDAARAYDEAAKKYHREFAHLNFP